MKKSGLKPNVSSSPNAMLTRQRLRNGTPINRSISMSANLPTPSTISESPLGAAQLPSIPRAKPYSPPIEFNNEAPDRAPLLFSAPPWRDFETAPLPAVLANHEIDVLAVELLSNGLKLRSDSRDPRASPPENIAVFIASARPHALSRVVVLSDRLVSKNSAGWRHGWSRVNRGIRQFRTSSVGSLPPIG